MKFGPTGPGKDSASPPSQGPRVALIAVMVFTVICAAAYHHILSVPFYLDTPFNITNNPAIRVSDLDLKSLARAAFESPISRRPLSNVSFALNYYISGLNPIGYRLTNIFIHILCGLLVYTVVLRTLALSGRSVRPQKENERSIRPEWVSLAVAALWVAHPVAVNVVTYAVQRMTSLAVLFFLAAWLCYIQGRTAATPAKRWTWFAAGCIAWFFSLAAKENGAVLPVVLLIYDQLFFQNEDSARTKKALLYALLAMGAIIGLAVVFMGENPITYILRGYASREFTLSERLWTQLRIVFFYITLLVWPAPGRMNLDHDFELSRSLFSPPETAYCALFLSLAIGLGFLWIKKRRVAAMGVFFFFINLLMESTVLSLELVFEHRIYLPMAGAALVAADFLRTARKGIGLVAIFCTAAIIGLTGATYARNLAFSDPVTLYSDSVEKAPKKWRPRQNLGLAFLDEGRLEEARVQLHAAAAINPDYSPIYHNLGVVYDRMGRTADAINAYGKALAINPGHSISWVNLGSLHLDRGDRKEARKSYEKALSLEPGSDMGVYGLGKVAEAGGDRAGAFSRYVEAVRLNPENAPALNDLGRLLAQSGQLATAIEHFKKAAALMPQWAEARYNLGRARLWAGDRKQAEEDLKAAWKMNPDLTEAGELLKTLEKGE